MNPAALIAWFKALPVLGQVAGYAGAALLAGGVLTGGYLFWEHRTWQAGYDAAAALCDHDKLQAKIDGLEADLRLAAAAIDKAQELADAADERAQTLDERLKTYDLPPPGGYKCPPLSDADARRLLELVK